MPKFSRNTTELTVLRGHGGEIAAIKEREMPRTHVHGYDMVVVQDLCTVSQTASVLVYRQHNMQQLSEAAPSDSELFAAYAQSQCETAFSEIVARYRDMVYS